MSYQEIIGTTRNDFAAIGLEPDALAPGRYREVFHSHQISPEKRLMIAVLDDAVQSFFAGIKPRRPRDLRHFQEAEQWIMASGCDEAFSFEWICNLLGLDPGYLRSGLEKLKAEARTEQHFRSARNNRSPHGGMGSGRSSARTKKTAGARRVFSASYNPGA